MSEIEEQVESLSARGQKRPVHPITERGKIIATIVAQEPSDVEKFKELARSGLGTWRGGRPKGAFRPVVVKGKPVRISCLRSDGDPLIGY